VPLWLPNGITLYKILYYYYYVAKSYTEYTFKKAQNETINC